MTAWRDSASCIDEHTELFFDAIWAPTDTGNVAKTNQSALGKAREFCRECPVRRACLGETMEYEAKDSAGRFGLSGYLTPGQRHSVARRKVLRCSCGAVRDPVDLEQGILRCPVRCGAPAKHMPIIDIEGDQWTKRHTALARRILAWVVDNVAVGEQLPTPHAMARRMETRAEDVVRVYQAFVSDVVLDQRGGRRHPTYWRVSQTGTMRDSHLVAYLSGVHCHPDA